MRLRLNLESGVPRKPGGFLLSFFSLRANSSYTYVGVHNLYRNEAGRQILFSDHFVEHPRYRGTRTSLKNDVALIKLPNGGVTFSGK